jgi:S-disulfanyl-L-cysteine oxidoreductase SoxD
VSRRLTLGLVLLSAAACGRGRPAEGVRPDTGGQPARYGVGRPATQADIAPRDIDVGPDGAGLPPGSGTWARGAEVYAAKCASCHGPKGEGVAPAYPRIVGREPREGFPFGRDLKYAKTVGNYWPYATTIFDYVRRAMPQQAPGSLTDDETYALVAWLLAENEVVAKDAVIDARTLPQVRMPARDRFVRDDRGGATFR